MALIAALALSMGTVTALQVGAEETYSPTLLFTVEDGSETGALNVGGTDYFSVNLGDEESISYKQDLALKWYEDGTARYFTLDLAYSSVAFDTLNITIETAQNSITKEKKTVNTLSLSSEAGAKTNDGDYVAVDFTSGAVITLANDVNHAAGSFDVLVNGVYVGAFENIGGFYAEYVSPNATDPKVPLTIDVETSGADAVQQLAVRSLNGQSFAVNADGRITDTAAPVLVVNEQIKSFILGYVLSVDYEVIDVCDVSVSKDMVYRQYGKEDAALTSSTYIYETSVSDEYGCEFVNIRYTLSDDSDLSRTYDLAWYTDSANLRTFDGLSYFSVGRNVTGPAYVGTEADYETYQSLIDEAAEGVSVGSYNHVYLPSLTELIVDDDTSYERLTFDIYYKTQNSSSASSSTGLSYDELSISVANAGKYSFKVLAYDKMGNGIYALYNGRMVKVTSSNVWNIDSIPEFTFTIYNFGVSIESPGEQDLGYIDVTYNVSDFEINAVSGYGVEYQLYYFDNDAYHAATGEWASLTQLMEDADSFRTYFTEIEEYNSAISEEDEAWDSTDNAYYWYPDSLSFKPQKTGFYVVQATVTDAELYGNQVTGYQIIEVTSEEDVMVGESDWLEENKVAVIFLIIAAVALIGILVLCFIKPEERDLDEIDLKKPNQKTKKEQSK